jgi:NADH-quinone oxidoreductase subunit J
MEFYLFFICAAIAIIGAAAMLFSKNAVHSALFLLLNFSSIAVLYLLLRAPFLFAVQLIVYAGAIIVLFLFVVMLLGAERAEDDRDALGWQRYIAIAMGGLLAAAAVVGLISRSGDAMIPTGAAAVEDFATPEKIGAVLFTQYLLPFQLTGIILLVAVVGVVVLSRADVTKER